MDKSLPKALQNDPRFGETAVRYEGHAEPEVLPSEVRTLGFDGTCG